MNICVMVEGSSGEKMVYEEWIPLVNSNLSCTDSIFDIVANNFCIVSGHGYPNYLQKINEIIQDVNTHGNIDRLVICVDAEDFSYDEKLEEINKYISGKQCSAAINIIVQFFCFETWALANKKIGPRNPKNDILKQYASYFDVLDNDPELMPAYPLEDLNRAQFAYKYLKHCLIEKGITYIKSKPYHIKHPTYFNEIKKRYNNHSHIKCFVHFLNAFS